MDHVSLCTIAGCTFYGGVIYSGMVTYIHPGGQIEIIVLFDHEGKIPRQSMIEWWVMN